MILYFPIQIVYGKKNKIIILFFQIISISIQLNTFCFYLPSQQALLRLLAAHAARTAKAMPSNDNHQQSNSKPLIVERKKKKNQKQWIIEGEESDDDEDDVDSTSKQLQNDTLNIENMQTIPLNDDNENIAHQWVKNSNQSSFQSFANNNFDENTQQDINLCSRPASPPPLPVDLYDSKDVIDMRITGSYRQEVNKTIFMLFDIVIKYLVSWLILLLHY